MLFGGRSCPRGLLLGRSSREGGWLVGMINGYYYTGVFFLFSLSSPSIGGERSGKSIWGAFMIPGICFSFQKMHYYTTWYVVEASLGTFCTNASLSL